MASKLAQTRNKCLNLESELKGIQRAVPVNPHPRLLSAFILIHMLSVTLMLILMPTPMPTPTQTQTQTQNSDSIDTLILIFLTINP